jgi:adenine-specific DNA-methyltransferase
MRNCQIFTPDIIVDKMLDMLDYTGENVKKTIFEPAFGNGAFLTKIVSRIMQYAQDIHLTEDETIALLDNVYGVEIDANLYGQTIDTLNKQISQYGIHYEWKHLVNADSLTYTAPILFDYAVSNPPFIRVHSLSQTERDCIKNNYVFGTGNTDLYVIFFEICLNKMKPDGKMCFITPNSFLKNTSQSKFRKYLSENNLVHTIIDYGDLQIFESVLTYSAITLIDLNKKDLNTICIKMNTLQEQQSQMSVNLNVFGKNPWILSKEHFNNQNKQSKSISDLCTIQYGVATNADAVYLVSKEHFNDFEPELLRPVIKGSTLDESKRIIFPYYWDDTTCRYYVISEHDMMHLYPKTYNYLLANKEKLLRRDMEKDCLWYQYARSQGIQNSRNTKIVLKHILSPDIRFCSCQVCDEQYVVYSGIFIVPKEGVDVSSVLKILTSEMFYEFVFESGKDMSGGYKSINTKIVKSFKY